MSNRPSKNDIKAVFLPVEKTEQFKNWYVKEKKLELDKVVKRLRADDDGENDFFEYPSVKVITEFLHIFRNSSFKGLRVHLGTVGNRTFTDREYSRLFQDKDRYKIVLIYSPEFKTNKEYYIIMSRDGVFSQQMISRSLFLKLVHDYQVLKQYFLWSTLDDYDRNNDIEETTSVFFEAPYIETILREAEHQESNNSQKIKGIQVCVASYDDNLIERPNSADPTTLYRLTKRLTILFVLKNIKGEPADMVVEDAAMYADINKAFTGSSYNTGNPTPPYDDY